VDRQQMAMPFDRLRCEPVFPPRDIIDPAWLAASVRAGLAPSYSGASRAGFSYELQFLPMSLRFLRIVLGCPFPASVCTWRPHGKVQWKETCECERRMTWGMRKQSVMPSEKILFVALVLILGLFVLRMAWMLLKSHGW